jgi:hypothetical protein
MLPKHGLEHHHVLVFLWIVFSKPFFSLEIIIEITKNTTNAKLGK